MWKWKINWIEIYKGDKGECYDGNERKIIKAVTPKFSQISLIPWIPISKFKKLEILFKDFSNVLIHVN